MRTFKIKVRNLDDLEELYSAIKGSLNARDFSESPTIMRVRVHGRGFAKRFTDATIVSNIMLKVLAREFGVVNPPLEVALFEEDTEDYLEIEMLR